MKNRGIVYACILVMSAAAVAHAQVPVIFDVNTNHPTDTIYVGNPAEVVFYVDAGPHALASIGFALTATFTNGLSFGPLVVGGNLHFSPRADSVFDGGYLHESTAPVQVPDSMYFDGLSFTEKAWTGADWFAKIQFEPQDTGTIIFDTIHVSNALLTIAVTPDAETIPIDWRPGPIVVANCPYVSGDLNGSGTVTVADILLLVIYVFKMGAPPEPYEEIADANGDDIVSASDIIYLVNYQGKSGPLPHCSTPH